MAQGYEQAGKPKEALTIYYRAQQVCGTPEIQASVRQRTAFLEFEAKNFSKAEELLLSLAEAEGDHRAQAFL